MTNGESVREIFKNALHYYNKVLKELKDNKEIDVSLPILQEDIQQKIKRNIELIDELESPGGTITVTDNRKFLCGCLMGYISYLERTKTSVITKLTDELSLPIINLAEIDEEIRRSKSILKDSCEHEGM
jgi:hypothetical protein